MEPERGGSRAALFLYPFVSVSGFPPFCEDFIAAYDLARYYNVRHVSAMSNCPKMEGDLLTLLHDVARSQRTRFDQWARSYGMTRAQMMILVRLSLQPGLSQNEMAELCEVEPISIGRLVDRLEARRLLERRPDPSDRRIRRLHLLPASEPILAEIREYKNTLQDYLTGGLAPGNVETMFKVLLHMKHQLAMESASPRLAAAGE